MSETASGGGAEETDGDWDARRLHDDTMCLPSGPITRRKIYVEYLI